MKKVFVTGAGGFWGYHLCKYLSGRGYKVIASYQSSKHDELKNLRWYRLDVTNRSQVDRAVRKIKPDVICHLAGQSSVTLSAKNPKSAFETNTASTLYFLNAISKFSSKTKFLYASSAHVYGYRFQDTPQWLTEDIMPHPDGPYGLSKRLSELACIAFYALRKVKTFVIRPVNCIGTGLNEHFVFSDWSNQIAHAERLGQKAFLKVGNLKVRRDFLHIADAVAGFETVLRKGKEGQIYNLSSQKSVPLNVYAKKLTKISRIPVKIQVDPTRFRKVDPQAIRISSAKLRRLGWKPKMSALEGLNDLMNYWRNRIV